jgi:hypothetical protein
MFSYFRVEQYLDANGEDVTAHVVKLFDADTPLLAIAAYIKQLEGWAAQKLPDPPPLSDTMVLASRDPHIQIWGLSEAGYSLMYSYSRDRNEVVLLGLFNGRAKAHLAETLRRIRDFYSLK